MWAKLHRADGHAPKIPPMVHGKERALDFVNRAVAEASWRPFAEKIKWRGCFCHGFAPDQNSEVEEELGQSPAHGVGRKGETLNPHHHWKRSDFKSGPDIG
jgi:hypothetical protein